MEQLSLLAEVDVAAADRERILIHLSENHPAYLELARAIAREIAVLHGSVTIDLVRDALVSRGLPMPKDVGADERLLGVLFRAKGFRVIGQRKTTREAFARRVGRARSSVNVYTFEQAA